MKSKWSGGDKAFSGLINRLDHIKDLWQKVIDLELDEIKRKATQLQEVADQVQLATTVSEMDRSELRGKVISDDLD